MHVDFTPSQLAANLAAKARAQRKIEAALRSAQEKHERDEQLKQELLAAAAKLTKPEPVKVEAPKPLIPDNFFTSLSRRIMWDGEYCPHSGGNIELLRNRNMTEIAIEWLKRFEGVTLKDLKGRSRMVHFTFPRQVIAFMIRRERPDISLPQIGRWMGNRDHTTIIHGNIKIQRMIDDDTFDAAMEQWQEHARGIK